MAQTATELVPLRLSSIPGLPTLTARRWGQWLAALTILLALAAASYLAYTGNVATSSYSSQRLRAERDTWRMRNDQLRLELAKVESLTWVEHEAVTRLNMRKPTAVTYVRMEPTSQRANGPEARPASAR